MDAYYVTSGGADHKGDCKCGKKNVMVSSFVMNQFFAFRNGKKQVLAGRIFPLGSECLTWFNQSLEVANDPEHQQAYQAWITKVEVELDNKRRKEWAKANRDLPYEPEEAYSD